MVFKLIVTTEILPRLTELTIPMWYLNLSQYYKVNVLQKSINVNNATDSTHRRFINSVLAAIFSVIQNNLVDFVILIKLDFPPISRVA